MPMRIRLTKRSDGGANLQCRRADGSVTWQTHQGHQAGFFPLHDLTHYAVETELKLDQAFYGLVASGWDIEETGGKSSRGLLPSDAILAEHIVGLLDLERGSGHLLSPDEFREALSAKGLPGSGLDDAAIAGIRASRSRLLAQWRELPAGETLELVFG